MFFCPPSWTGLASLLVHLALFLMLGAELFEYPKGCSAPTVYRYLFIASDLRLLYAVLDINLSRVCETIFLSTLLRVFVAFVFEAHETTACGLWTSFAAAFYLVLCMIMSLDFAWCIILIQTK